MKTQTQQPASSLSEAAIRLASAPRAIVAPISDASVPPSTRIARAREMTSFRRAEPHRSVVPLFAHLLTLSEEKFDVDRDRLAAWNSKRGCLDRPGLAFDQAFAPFGSHGRAAAMYYAKADDIRRAWLVMDALNRIRTPLSWAYFHSCVRRFPDWPVPRPTFKLDQRDKSGTVVFNRAAACCDADFLEFLIGERATTQSNRHGRTALHDAIEHQRASADIERIIDTVLNAGVLIDAGDRDGLTPLHLAAHRGLAHFCGALLARGADPTIRDRSNRSAHDLVPNVDPHQVRPLLVHAQLGASLTAAAPSSRRRL